MLMFVALVRSEVVGGRVNQRGQATAEYALLTGAIALVIALVAAWATSTGKVRLKKHPVLKPQTKQ